MDCGRGRERLFKGETRLFKGGWCKEDQPIVDGNRVRARCAGREREAASEGLRKWEGLWILEERVSSTLGRRQPHQQGPGGRDPHS